MKKNKILILAFIVTLVALVTGCDNKSEKQPFPEVNDENCAFQAVKAMPQDQQQEFSSMCLRRGSYKSSPKKEW
ncbi:entry exclusion lipoprotein TrbK [Neisseriaceae bacterium ESL0693]|nr:entry exclusion lipoprotein TrbK [Neisseriaceae bacterium ESL0693]